MQSRSLSHSISRIFPIRAEINVYLFKSVIVTQLSKSFTEKGLFWRFEEIFDCIYRALKIKVLRKLRNVFKCLTFVLQKKK